MGRVWVLVAARIYTSSKGIAISNIHTLSAGASEGVFPMSYLVLQESTPLVVTSERPGPSGYRIGSWPIFS